MNLSGPQSSRDKTWVRKPAELSGDREDLVIDRTAEKQVYEGELGRVRRENASLRDQLQRTLKELKAYQLQYPELVSRESSEAAGDLPPWNTSADVMSPLLTCYDTRIAELQEQAEQQATQLEQFHQKVEEVLAENDSLRERLLNTASEGSMGLDPVTPLNMELMNELNEKVDILMSENALLVEQKAVLASELEENGTMLEERSNQIVELCERVTRLSEENTSLREECEQANSDRKESAEQALQANEALSRVKVQLEESREEVLIWEQRSYKAEKAVAERDAELKAALAEHNKDSDITMQRMKTAEERVKELHSMVLQKTHDLDVAQDVARKLRREYQSTRQDAEGMLQVMAGLERQLSEYSSRESEVEKMCKDSKEKMEEALVDRDQAKAREEQMRREVDRLYDEKKKLTVTRHQEVDAAVQAAKDLANGQMKSLESDLHQVSSTLVRYKAEEERASRERKSAQELLEKTRKAHEAETRGMEQAMGKLEERIRSVVHEREEALLKSKEVQELNTELRLLVDKLRSQEEMHRVAVEEKDASRRKEIEQLRSQLKEAQRELSEAHRGEHRRQKELDDLHREEETKTATLAKNHAEEVAMYRRRAQEAEQSMKEMELTAASEEHRVRLLLEQFKEKASLGTLKLEGQLNDTRETLAKLMESKNALDLELQGAYTEKKRYMSLLQDSKMEINRLQDSLADYKSENMELSNQLASSLEAREVAAKQKGRSSKYLNNDMDLDEYDDKDYNYLGYGDYDEENISANVGRYNKKEEEHHLTHDLY